MAVNCVILYLNIVAKFVRFTNEKKKKKKRNEHAVYVSNIREIERKKDIVGKNYTN